MLLQGLANLLWAYAKLAEPPVEVISSIMSQMTDMLTRDQTGGLFDAQVSWSVHFAQLSGNVAMYFMV